MRSCSDETTIWLTAYSLLLIERSTHGSHGGSLSDRAVDFFIGVGSDLRDERGRRRVERDGFLYDGRRTAWRPRGRGPRIPRLPDDHCSRYPENRPLTYADQPLHRRAVRDQSVVTDEQ